MARDLAERLGRLADLRGHAVGAVAVRIAVRSANVENALVALIEQTHHVAGKASN